MASTQYTKEIVNTEEQVATPLVVHNIPRFTIEVFITGTAQVDLYYQQHGGSWELLEDDVNSGHFVQSGMVNVDPNVGIYAIAADASLGGDPDDAVVVKVSAQGHSFKV